MPPRDLVFAFVSDEEHGGKYGCQWLVDNRPDLFEGVTEAIGEVGGFSLTVPRRDGGERRLYLIETAEKGMRWMRLTARGRAGHGSMVHDDNAVTAVAEAVARLGRHQFPLVLTDPVEQFLTAVGEETGYEFDLNSPDLDGAIAKLGAIARIVGATLRDTANPTMLKAGYKANVIPATAEAVVDCRVLPGRRAAFEREVDELIGPNVTREWITDLPSYETTFDGDLVDAMNAALLDRRPRRPHRALHAVRRYRRETLCALGYSLLRLRPAAAAAGTGLRGAVPRRRRTGTRRRAEVRHRGSRPLPAALLTRHAGSRKDTPMSTPYDDLPQLPDLHPDLRGHHRRPTAPTIRSAESWAPAAKTSRRS